jgi:hypothetical protein
MSEEQKKGIKDKDDYINNIVKMHSTQTNIPWMEFFIQYDPEPALEKVKCPVLMLFGGKDLQVPPKQNKEPMENALNKGGNKDVTISIIPDANHLFQSSITGSPDEYGKLPKEFAPGFLDTITSWILKHVTIVK